MLFRIIIIAIVIYLLYKIIRIFRKAKSAGVNRPKPLFKTKPVTGEDLVEDPACHTYIPLSQAFKKEIAGKNHYFCSKECCESYILGKSKERQ